MKRLSPVLIAVAVGACSANPAPTAAQAAPGSLSEPTPTLNVNATATVQRAPDLAVIQLAVETVAATAGEASDQNAAAMDAVLAAVRDRGIPSDAIRTQRLELQPRYDNSRDRTTPAAPEIVGYRAVNQVTVRVRDVSAVGDIVDAAVRAGANRVTGIRFELSDPESAYHEALRRAVDRARAEAEVTADALGMRLGEPLQVSTGGFSGPMPQARFDMMAMERAQGAPPVEPGEVEVQASVSIAWRLES